LFFGGSGEEGLPLLCLELFLQFFATTFPASEVFLLFPALLVRLLPQKKTRFVQKIYL
jgi:hypothetical protein